MHYDLYAIAALKLITFDVTPALCICYHGKRAVSRQCKRCQALSLALA